MKIELEYMEKTERGEAPSIEELVETYPDMREELAEFALDYVSIETEGEAAEPSEESLKAAAAARESVLERVPAYPTQPEEPSSLVEVRRASGERLGTLAAAVNVPRDVLSALEDGVIGAESAPAKLCNRLGQALGLTPESIRSFIAEAGGRSAALHFSAREGLPERRRKITFEEALRASRETNEGHLRDWLPSNTERKE